MRKLISNLLIVAFALPLMAQEVEVKEVDGNTEVTVKKQHDKSDMRAWKQRGDMKRGAGGIRSANADMSSDKECERHSRRNPKVSCVKLICAGLVDP